MNNDTDIQTWLELEQNAPPAIIVPFVSSAKPRQLDYRIRAHVTSGAGQSRISQGGTVQVPANAPTPLARLSLQYSLQGNCNIDIELEENGVNLGVKRFKCP
jgi:hypothetical protein